MKSCLGWLFLAIMGVILLTTDFIDFNLWILWLGLIFVILLIDNKKHKN